MLKKVLLESVVGGEVFKLDEQLGENILHRQHEFIHERVHLWRQIMMNQITLGNHDDK
jgi:hypothetical protein